MIIAPDDYVVLTKDGTLSKIYPECSSKIKIVNFGTLGNSGDGAVIYDAWGKAVDSVLYFSSWGGANGRSIERLSAEANSNDSINWKTSVSALNGTPGCRNSILNLILYNKKSTVINEIMYDPVEGNSDYIELINISDKQINLAGWSVCGLTGNGGFIYGDNLFLAPDSFYVLASDSSLFFNYDLKRNTNVKIIGSRYLSLSNNGEAVIIKDAFGNPIDSVYYRPVWGNKNFNSTKNISLEKINPALEGNMASNWSSSVDSKGGTPGRKNSIFTENKSSGSNLSVSPNPFSPDNDGYEDFTLIKFSLKSMTAGVRIRIFNSRGYKVRTIEDCLQSGQEGSVVFDGLDDNKNPLRIGIYIILLEAFTENSAVLESIKKVVVIARKLN